MVETPHVVVVGGGMAGLAATRALERSGATVTLLEAGRDLGGCVRAVPFSGRLVDVGAESLHTAAPGPLDLVADLGLVDELVEARRGRTWIARGRRLRALPAGVGPAGPTRLAPLVTAGLLGPGGLLRAALEPLVPPRDPRPDVAVGAALERRFGPQVVDRLVDPLLGGLHAGDVRRLSVQAATPQLAAALATRRSLVLTRRRGGRHASGFVTLLGGLGRLVEVLRGQSRAEVITSARVCAVVDTRRGPHRYVVRTDTGTHHPADGVVLALPAAETAAVLSGLDATAAGLLQPLRAASVAVVLLAYSSDAPATPALSGTGVLVPSSRGQLLKGATFLTSKWPHLARSPQVLVRASTGRADDTRAQDLDDHTLVARLADELSETVGLSAAPVDAAVVRWPAAMPQLEVGHRERVAAVRARLAAHPGLAIAGAAIDGIGVAAALRSGTAAATDVLEHLAERHGAAA